MLPTTFRSIWSSCFRLEDFQKSTNQKQELPVVAMFVNGSGQNEQSLQRIFHKCFLPSFGLFNKAVSKDKICRNRPIRNKNCLWQPYLLMDRDEISNFIENLPQMHPTKSRFIWQSSFRGEDFLEINQSVVAMFGNGSGRNQQSYNRGLSIDASYQVSDHLDKRFQRRRFFRNRPIRNKNCLWRPCL